MTGIHPADGDGERMLAHDLMNHVHVILGNLELLQEQNPDDRLIADARQAAAEVSRLLREQRGRGGASAARP